MEFYSGNRENVLKKLGSSQKSGLTNEEAEENKLKYGVNQFSQGKKESLIVQIMAALKEPMIFILIFASFITLFVNLYIMYKGGKPDFIEYAGILAAKILATSDEEVLKKLKAYNKLSSDNCNQFIFIASSIFFCKDQNSSGNSGNSCLRA